MKLETNYSLKNENTFHIDVSAKYFAEVFSEEDIKNMLSERRIKEIPLLIIGGGSNILFTRNFDGLVIKNSISYINVIEEDDNKIIIEAGAGVRWDDLVQYCVEKKYGGIENLSLIPGTTGAAPIQNIGAYGQELKDTLYYVKGIFIENLALKKIIKDECNFGYRDSIFKRELKGKFVITAVAVCLSKKPKVNLTYAAVNEELDKLNIKEPSIKEVSKVIRMIRETKLPNPTEIGNAGSFFKNPEISESLYLDIKNLYQDFKGYKLPNGYHKISAAWLIEKCGWKGQRFGDAGVHKDQPLVLVNFGTASGNEIRDLSLQIKESVFKKFKIELEEEVNIF